MSEINSDPYFTFRLLALASQKVLHQIRHSTHVKLRVRDLRVTIINNNFVIDYYLNFVVHISQKTLICLQCMINSNNNTIVANILPNMMV